MCSLVELASLSLFIELQPSLSPLTSVKVGLPECCWPPGRVPSQDETRVRFFLLWPPLLSSSLCVALSEKTPSLSG